MLFGKFSQLTSEQLGEAIKAFMAEDCPGCKGEKKRLSDPFCDPCCDKLPEELYQKLLVRESFIVAYHEAMQHLLPKDGSARGSRSTSPKMPPGNRRRGSRSNYDGPSGSV